MTFKFKFIKKLEYNFIRPSEEWEDAHVHSEFKIIETI